MSTPRTPPRTLPSGDEKVTSPSSTIGPPLMPPLTDEKITLNVRRILAFFNDIKAGRAVRSNPWKEFQLEPGEYDQIEREIKRDESLSGYIEDKLRYDYDRRSDRLIVRMPATIHEFFLKNVEQAIENQLNSIRCGSEKAALFAQKIRLFGSPTIEFPTGSERHVPDSAFGRKKATYPGVIIEVANSQKAKDLNRLAEDYLVGSRASVQAVVGLDIEYGNTESRKATLSVWRTQVVQTDTTKQLRVIQEPANEVFRDDQGNPTNHSGLLLRLSDFAYGLPAQDITGHDEELIISAQQLCELLNEAEEDTPKMKDAYPIDSDVIAKKSVASEEEINSSDERNYVEQEERAERCTSGNDPEYVDM